MEEEIKLFKHATGPKFARVHGGWFAGFGFYWFCLMFYRNCGPEIFSYERSHRWTGFVFSWMPNPFPAPGALIWLKSKKWGVYAA